MDAAEPTPEGLRDAAVAGVRWIAIAKVVGESAQLVAAVVLARLIVPAEFGHAAIALILVPLAAILTFEGFGSALVQRKEIDQGHLETAMLASLVGGAVLSALTFLLAPLIAVPLFGERTAELVQLASPLFLIAGFSAVSRSLLWRELEFRNVSLIETGSVALGAAVEPDAPVRQLGLVLQEVASAREQLDRRVAQQLALAVRALRERDLVTLHELGRRHPDERDLLERAVELHLIFLTPVAHCLSRAPITPDAPRRLLILRDRADGVDRRLTAACQFGTLRGSWRCDAAARNGPGRTPPRRPGFLELRCSLSNPRLRRCFPWTRYASL